MGSRSILAVLAALGGLVGATFVTAVAAPAPAVQAASGTTSAYVAMPTSQRLLDTRQSTPVLAGQTISVSVAGRSPLPAPGTITAAVLNLTVVPPSGPGFWTVWPHGNPRPGSVERQRRRTAVPRGRRHPQPGHGARRP